MGESKRVKKMDKNMEKMETRLLPVGSIRVAERIRKDNGGLEELANDIREHGLINPITVMEQTEGGYVLIAGLRRLKAMELLGAEEIRATVMTALEADEMLMLEIAENEQRKEFTVSEKLAFAEKLKAVEAEKARVRKSAGGKGGLDQDVGNCPHLQEQGRSRDIVAQKAGFSSDRQMRRAQAVSESRPDLMEQVDKGEKSISGAYSDMQRVAAGGEEPQATVKAKMDDDVLTGLIQEKPVEVPEFDVYRPALEPAPGKRAHGQGRGSRASAGEPHLQPAVRQLQRGGTAGQPRARRDAHALCGLRTPHPWVRGEHPDHAPDD